LRTALSLVGLCLLAAPVAAAEEPPLAADTVARVEDRAILKADYEHWLAIAAAGEDVPAPGSDEYKELSDDVVRLLISNEWIVRESRERGIFISKAAARAELRRRKRQSFPSERDYRRWRESTHRTEADVLRSTYIQMLADRLVVRAQAGAKSAGGKQRRLQRWVKRYDRKWRKRTVCGEPYVVRVCARTAPITP
jgi:hypothetical protein